MEHRLTSEQATDGDTVEPADQGSVAVPYLDGMGPAEMVKLGVGIDEIVSDPAVGAIRIGAAGNDGLEVLVDGDQISPRRLPKGSTHPEALERDDRSLDRRPPPEMPIGCDHREHSSPVCLQNRARLEVATHGYDVAFDRCRVREVETGGDRLYGHTPDCVRCVSRCVRHSVNTMRALICDDYGGIESLRVGELPDPQPDPGSVLVKVEAVTVNFADTLMVKGEYQVRPDPPFAPGYELTGTVIVSNQVKGISPGDRVAGFAFHGGLAEKAVILGQNAARIPDSMSSDLASTLPGGYGTSYHALVDRAALKPGETLLVLGASGGVGMAAVQIGRALGATVIAAVSSEEKADAANAAGAHQVIRYDQTPIREAIDRVTAGAGVDVVYDPVGGEATEQVLRSTKWNGRVLVIGFAAGQIPSIPLNLPLLKGNSIVGVFWGRFTQEEPDRHRANFAHIIEWARDGTIEPIIQRTYSLDDGAEALRWVAERRAVGRIVVNP